LNIAKSGHPGLFGLATVTAGRRQTDPVGGAGNGTKPSSVEAWSSVLAAPTDRNSSDTVASAGRAFFGSTATSGADSQKLDTNHAEFPSMMSDGGAQKKIDASYQDRKDEQ